MKNKYTASFRGVPFALESADWSGGRRVSSHSFPGSEHSIHEDLGASPAELKVEGLIIGQRYPEGSQNLTGALQRKGPGEFYHPEWGKYSMQVVSFSVKHSTKQGGMARYSIAFKEISQTALSVIPDTSAQLATAVKDANATTASVFSQAADVGTMAEDLIQAAEKNISKSLGAFVGVVNDLGSRISSAIRVPANLVAEVQGALAEVAASVEEPQRALALYRTGFLAGDDWPEISPTTTTRANQEIAQEATRQMLQQATVLAAAGLVAEMGPESGLHSSSDALNLLMELRSRLEELAAIAQDESRRVLLNVRDALVEELTGRAGNLPQLRFYKPKSTQPCAVIAQLTYGAETSGRKVDQITHRNHVMHPLFVSPGFEVEVVL